MRRCHGDGLILSEACNMLHREGGEGRRGQFMNGGCGTLPLGARRITDQDQWLAGALGDVLAEGPDADPRARGGGGRGGEGGGKKEGGRRRRGGEFR